MTDFKIKKARTARLLASSLLLAVVIISLPFFTNGFLLSLSISGGLLALAAMPLTILTGTAGLLSLGHAAFLGLGGYAAGILAHQFHIGLTASIFVGAAVGLVIGGLIAITTLRVVGIYLAVGTFALQFAVQPLMQNIDVELTHSTGFMLTTPVLFGIALDSQTRWWYAISIVAVLIYSWLSWLQRSHIGRRWIVLRDNTTAAGVLGISLQKTRIGAFALTSAITAGVGALSAYYYGNAQSGLYSIHLAILFLTIVALGGAGNLVGAIIASFVMIALSPLIEALIAYGGFIDPSRAGGIETILVGVILMLSLLIRGRISREKKNG